MFQLAFLTFQLLPSHQNLFLRIFFGDVNTLSIKEDDFLELIGEIRKLYSATTSYDAAMERRIQQICHSRFL